MDNQTNVTTGGTSSLAVVLKGDHDIFKVN